MESPSHLHRRTPDIAIRRRFPVAPLLFGIVLFAINQAPIVAAYLFPAPGYVGIWLPMHMDFQQYRTWMIAFQQPGVGLLPDYHAPWYTEPALLNPLCWAIGKSSAAIGVDGLWIYYLLTLALTIGGSYALWFTVRVFTESRAQARIALLLSTCCVPVPAVLAVVPLVFGRSNQVFGFVWWASKVLGRFSSDGFWNGICGGPLVLLGTVTTILSMGLLASYLKTGASKSLVWAGLVAGVGALLHPFEIFVVMAAGSLTLLMHRKPFRDLLYIVVPGALGLAPYLILSSEHPWLARSALQNRWQALSPPLLLLLLGLPALFCLASYVLPLGKRSVTDSLLTCWFATTLIGVYVPFLPWQHHLLDGVNYAIALLAVRQIVRWKFARDFAAARPSAARGLLAAIVLASLAAHAIYWQDAVTAARLPGGEGSAVVSRTDVAILGWLRHHSAPSDLLLAPKASAGWFATVPMHSFASHWLFSLTWEEQARRSDAFYLGNMEDAAAQALLADFGVRYTVIPNGSPAARYFAGRPAAAVVGGASIYKLPNAAMKRYPALSER